MGAAVAYDLFKNRNVLDFGAIWEIVIGFGMAFITAVLVVRWVLNFVGKRGYALFGWWRIIIGLAALAALFAGF
jgi:undecaprenyl-diphosphatase